MTFVSTTPAPRFPVHTADFDDDDFGPEPTPVPAVSAYADPAVAAAELAGRQLGQRPSWERWG